MCYSRSSKLCFTYSIGPAGTQRKSNFIYLTGCSYLLLNSQQPKNTFLVWKTFLDCIFLVFGIHTCCKMLACCMEGSGICRKQKCNFEPSAVRRLFLLILCHHSSNSLPSPDSNPCVEQCSSLWKGDMHLLNSVLLRQRVLQYSINCSNLETTTYFYKHEISQSTWKKTC